MSNDEALDKMEIIRTQKQTLEIYMLDNEERRLGKNTPIRYIAGKREKQCITTVTSIYKWMSEQGLEDKIY